MDRDRRAIEDGRPIESRSGRTPAFLVSTTGCAGDLRRHLGSADYSYGFVLNAIEPALRAIGRVEVVPVPEASLSIRAARARAEGFEPIHIALQPAQNAYFAPDVPNVLFPFWEFPDLPSRDFGHDTRQNWPRMCRAADLIVTACRFTADAFRAAGIAAPTEIIPVPVPAWTREVPPWTSRTSRAFECRHLVLGGDPRAINGPDWGAAGGPIEATAASPLWKRAIRAGYRRHLRPWLDPSTIERVKRFRRTITRAGEPAPPLLPTGRLELSGLTFLSLFNPSDRRKNAVDLTSAFLLALGDRPDATLVLKLATGPAREFYDVAEFLGMYRALGIEHRCRLVLLTDFLDDESMSGLYDAATFYVNTSRAEGACLPLQQALASGRPAIAPAHTSMADYVDESVALVVESHPEPTFWPHDPEQRYETTWRRLVWSDLRDRFLEAASMIDGDPDRYRSLAEAGARRLAGYGGLPAAVAGWSRVVGRLGLEEVATRDVA